MSFLETLRQDVFHSCRIMWNKPGFTATVVTTLALAIGANAAVFSIVRAVFLQPLPYKDPSRLVAIWDKNVHDSGISKLFDSYQDYQAVARNASSFDRVAAATWAVGSREIRGHGRARNVLAMPVSESFFPLLGVAPALGRTFIPEDLKGCAVVLSDRFWHSAFAADPKLPGQTIALDDRPCAVVGIMPPGFAFYPESAGLWMLLTPGFTPAPDRIPMGIFARLRPGVTMDQAQSELLAIHTSLHHNDGKEKDLVPVVHNLKAEFTFLAESGLNTTLWMLLGAVAFVLLIACLNVANLLLGHAVGRSRELAVRTALGGSRRRLIRQLFTESLILACLGGAAGMAVAFSAIRLFRAFNPVEMPVGVNVTISWPVVAFTATVSVLTALLFGLLPAWRTSRIDAIEGLKAGGRAAISGAPAWIMNVVITAEMALSLVLLAGAGLLMRSVLQMDSEPLGFRPQGLGITSVNLPASRYDDTARRLEFHNRLLARVGEHAAIATELPPYNGFTFVLHIAGKPVLAQLDRHDVGQRTVSPGYFSVMGTRLLRGRTFDKRDQASSEAVAVINEAIAREYFAESNPIGQHITTGDPGQMTSWRTIVGVVSNEKNSRNYRQIGWIEQGNVFLPLTQNPPRSFYIATRGSAHDLQSAVAAIDPEVAVGDVETMQTRLGRLLAYPRFRASLLGAFAGFSVLLAVIGLYGVLGQFLAQRTPEIGLRIAVGARPLDVLRLIAFRAGRPVLSGLIAGLAVAAALQRYLSSLLYGVEPADPITFGMVCGVLFCAAALAAFLPARRAMRVDPMIALRNE